MKIAVGSFVGLITFFVTVADVQYLPLFILTIATTAFCIERDMHEPLN